MLFLLFYRKITGVIHHTCMIGSNDGGGDAITASLIDNIPEDLTVTINKIPFTRKKLFFRMDMI